MAYGVFLRATAIALSFQMKHAETSKMNTSWKNTREAIKNFANVLACNKCGNKPIEATRYTNCGHFFCKQCTGNASVCVTCDSPVQPTEISNDHLINSLVSYCSTLAAAIDEKDLWGKREGPNTTQAAVYDATFRIPKNINKVNEKGETLLHVACLKNQIDRVKALLAAGANPNTKDYTGWTLLQEVVNYGYTEVCRLLLECGALVNTPGTRNRRALHDAAMFNRLEEARMLLKFSASKDVYDDHGKKPIDYCKANSEMWNLLKEKNESNDEGEELSVLYASLNQSISAAQSSDKKIVVYASNLRDESKRYLEQMCSKHKIKTVSAFRSRVTHVVVEANSENVVQLSYDVMLALVRGCWLLNTDWIQLRMDASDILKGDLEVFEVRGAPIEGIPKKARESAQNQNPALFDHCCFYFALNPKNTYRINDAELTRDKLATLVQAGNGTVLTREPNPEDVDSKEQFIPFHVANELDHPLRRCTHYIMYAPGKDEPRIKYNMPYIKTLPLIWLIECIEKFTLVDPSQLGLLA